MTASVESVEIAQVAALAADEKLATDVVVLDVSEQLVITDCFVIASAPNERQVNAIVDNVEEKLREAGHKPVRREGTREGRWALLDYVDVVVHIQHNDERNFYALERLWKDCPVVPVDGIGAPENRPAAVNGDADSDAE
ncbi:MULTISPECIES: ribosome silencing factor [Nocardia]|uniref:Ribosomal silencing factor RsfS n=1 Tax=Nocardia vulneris TaxID=1141657 RepID=A0ABR4ZDD3_9NOCA|nr:MULTISPECIES: ribosome silencing factor [Nocardia]ASF09254.1 ribosome silencing factor [Nocardia brasiliensis]KIA63253.1 Iojap family protein [Nocardia vulneris]MBF6126895.1 ribosome silencing factor [Nocardia brasiliensis]MBF6547733.1 ribosome silencing factor [Nocardia brasiliensis]SUB40078.1 ribosome-associated protein [Nocardia brasiliensis]